MIRSLRLADAGLLFLFLSKSPVDEARARCRLSERGRELAALFPLLRDCIVTQDTAHSYICVRNGLIQGLACLHQLLVFAQRSRYLCQATSRRVSFAIQVLKMVEIRSHCHGYFLFAAESGAYVCIE